MSEGCDILVFYLGFADALTEVLAENAVDPARRGRLARARATFLATAFGGALRASAALAIGLAALA
jgi:hypothetical protein